jgi:hypothetical protein
MINFTESDFLDISDTKHLQESDPTLIAHKINDLGVNAVKNNEIDFLLKMTISNEAKGRNEIPIGNGKTLDLRNCEECRNFYNQIVELLNIRKDTVLDVERKIKNAINDVYKGEGQVPFPEALPDND